MCFLLSRFPDLFTAIEDEISAKGSLGIDSYGVSMTTLEEIFLHLGEEEEARKEEEEMNGGGPGSKEGKKKKKRNQDEVVGGCIIR